MYTVAVVSHAVMAGNAKNLDVRMAVIASVFGETALGTAILLVCVRRRRGSLATLRLAPGWIKHGLQP